MGTPGGAEGRGTLGAEDAGVAAEDPDIGHEEVRGHVTELETAGATDAVVFPPGRPAAAVVGVVYTDESEKPARTPALQCTDDKHDKRGGGDPRWIPKDSVNVTRRLLDVKVRNSCWDLEALC